MRRGLRAYRGQITPSLFRQVFGPYVNGQLSVPPNAVIVMGDNFDNSMDSRDFGPITQRVKLLGKVINP